MPTGYHPFVVDLLAHVAENIGARRLLSPGQGIVVAVSGGVDSVVLLDLLHQLSRKHRWRLRIAHLNHRLRGRGSDADERLVRILGTQLNIPLVVEKTDLRKIASAGKISIEMAARQVRHEFLARVAAKHKIRVVALAHQADDQVELFFLRLLRGGGTEALAGMKWQSPSPATARIELLRPLLDVPKAELYAYARERRLDF